MLATGSRVDRRTQQVKRPRLTEGGVPCGYCFSRWATEFDHLIPWVYGGTEQPSNLYPSCSRCNRLLGSLIFNTLEEKREYVRDTLIARGQWEDCLPTVRDTIQEDAEAPSILFTGLPLERLDTQEGGIGSSKTRGDKTPEPAARICLKCLRPFIAFNWWCGNDCIDAYLRSWDDRRCPMCGIAFKPRTMNHFFCTTECRRSFWKGEDEDAWIFRAARVKKLEDKS